MNNKYIDIIWNIERTMSNFVYCITHLYYPDDYCYPKYIDLHRIYLTQNEALRQICNMYTNIDTANLHFQVIQYQLNQIDENNQDVQTKKFIIYDSYFHYVDDNLQILTRNEPIIERYPQVRRLV